MKIEDVWYEVLNEYATKEIGEENYFIKLINPQSPFNIFAGIDGARCVLLAIEIDSRPPEIDLETQSLSYFRQQRKSRSWLMILRLNNLELLTVFGRLCQDLIDAASTMPSQAALIKLFKDRLNLWKKLFHLGSDGLLEKNEVKGLLAELIALEYFLDFSEHSKLITLTAWTGPQGFDQDFIFNSKVVEVKSIHPSSLKVSISSIEQLDSVLPIELWIYVLRDSSSEEEGNLSLNNQVLKIEHKLANDPKALSIFKSKLLEARYVEHDFYESCCYKVIEENRYTVTDNFPRLTRAPLNLGILEASYSLSISAISDFRIQ